MYSSKFFYFLFIFFLSFKVSANGVDGQIVFSGDAVHLEFQGREQWNYQLDPVDKTSKAAKSNSKKINLVIEPFSEELVKELGSFKSDIIKKINVDKAGPDNRYSVTFDLAENVESFDYLTDQPSRLIIDFYRKHAKVQKPKTPEKINEFADEVPPKANRKPATSDILVVAKDAKIENEFKSDKEVVSEVDIPDPKNEKNAEASAKKRGIFDGGDPNFERFSMKDFEIKESAILAALENIYIDYPMLRIEMSYLHDILQHPPVYKIEPVDNQENKEARLLLTLFNKRRYAVYLKTLKWFLEKYPKSEYLEMISFMSADVHFNQYLEQKNQIDFDIAMLRYGEALDKFPKSKLAERTWLLMGFAKLDSGDALGTLSLFQKYLTVLPNSPNRDIAQFALETAYLKLKKYSEAYAIADKLEKEGVSPKARYDAAFSKGDIFLQKANMPNAEQNSDENYIRANDEYVRALKKYPDQSGNYPNAWYNQAEAQFGIKKYKKALDIHSEFLKKFPSHSYAGYSMTRIGEILEILGADESRIMGAYLETFFRYGDKPGALVARVRLVNRKMKDMKDKEVEPAIAEILKLTEKSELAKINQFVTILISDGYAQRKNYDKSIDLLSIFYQNNPTTSDKKLIRSRIVRNVNAMFKNEVEEGNFIKALQTHGKYSKSAWMSGSNRLDTQYYLARSYELAGVPKEAEVLYRETLNKIYSLKGTPELKKRAILESLPTEDHLNLRLSSISIGLKKYAQAYEYLKSIKKPDALKEKEQIERIQLAAFLMDQKGDSESAIRYLTELLNVWRGMPLLMAEPYLDLAQMEMKLDKKEDAALSLEKVRTLMKESGKVDPLTHQRSLELLGQIRYDQKEIPKCIDVYSELLSSYETKKKMPSIRYRLGKIQFDQGDLQKAAATWDELKKEENIFWYNLAQENLKGSQWEGEYKKYMKRIPAMSR